MRRSWSTGPASRWLMLVLALLLWRSSAAGATAWPAESWTAATDLTALDPSGWVKNLSGGYWNPVTRRLWVCTNSPAKFWSLKEDGVGGFAIEREYTGSGDLEGITQISTVPDRVFAIDEQARTIRSYRISDGAAQTTWLLSAIPDWGNSGPEGIAFVPDAWLARSGFTGANGSPYPQSVYGANGFGGLVFIAVQTSGWVYAFDLKTDGTYTYVGRYLTTRTESCELTFDASVGRLYILHNIGGNFLQVTDLTSTVSGSDRRFSAVAEFQVPSTSNIEGFALTPAMVSATAVGDNWCFFTDDDNANGALRWFKQLHSRLAKLSGDGQTAGTGAPVALPPAVQATDGFANPLAGFGVGFAVASGGGAVAGAAATADATGRAAVGSWTLGAVPGPNTLTATAAGLVNSPLTFTATGVDLTPPTVSIDAVVPDPRVTPVDSVRIVFSEPVAHFDLSHLLLTRGGGPNLLTGSEGLATSDRATWTLDLAARTGAQGAYTLTLTPAGITDDAGNALAGGAQIAWVTDAPVSVPEPGGRLHLGAPIPNPGRGGLRIPFSIPRDGHVAFHVFDLRGRIVATLVQGTLARGPHWVEWNGRRADGSVAPAGVYFYRLQVPGETRTARGCLMR
jgi:hypothetical protein